MGRGSFCSTNVTRPPKGAVYFRYPQKDKSCRLIATTALRRARVPPFPPLSLPHADWCERVRATMPAWVIDEAHERPAAYREEVRRRVCLGLPLYKIEDIDDIEQRAKEEAASAAI